MKMSSRCVIAVVAVACGLVMWLNTASAGGGSSEQLSAEWWQWALSIPTPVNPQLDTTGDDCMVGQSGPVWFLAGSFGGGSVTRNCDVPEGTSLFFPAINSVNIDAPNVCGQGSDPIPVGDLRAFSEQFIDGVSDVFVHVDDEPVHTLQRVRSKVFWVALPEDNVFDGPCSSLGGVPAGIYSPAVDDGYYALVQPLQAGDHTLHIHAEGSGGGVIQDITYNLTVVPVSRGAGRSFPQ